MNNELVWSEFNEKLSDNEIMDVEKRLNVKFPQDYIDIVSVYDGAYPFPNKFKINDHEEIFNNLLSFKEDDYSNILERFNDISDRVEGGIIPIAEDPFGNLICFDFRYNENPDVVFWDYEKSELDKNSAIIYIAKSFTELLNQLYVK